MKKRNFTMKKWLSAPMLHHEPNCCIKNFECKGETWQNSRKFSIFSLKLSLTSLLFQFSLQRKYRQHFEFSIFLVQMTVLISFVKHNWFHFWMMIFLIPTEIFQLFSVKNDSKLTAYCFFRFIEYFVHVTARQFFRWSTCELIFCLWATSLNEVIIHNIH